MNMKLENFIKGPLTSILGVVLMSFAFYAYAITKEFTAWQAGGLALVGFLLVFMRLKLEDFVSEFIKAVIEKFRNKTFVLLFVIPFAGLSQQTEIDLNNQNNTSIRGKIYNATNAANMYQNVIAAKMSKIIFYGDDLGLVGNGTTDNYATLQSIVNTYAGSVIQIGRSTNDVYLISRQISLPSNTRLIINGTIKLKATTEQPILTTVTNGSTTVDVTNASTLFVVGERIVISSDTQPINGGGAWKTRKVGKTNVIQSIAGNTITFTTAFQNILGTGSFTPGDNAKIASAEGAFRIDGVSNISITGNGVLDGNISNRYNVAGAIAGVAGDEDLQSNVGILTNNSTDINIQGTGGKLTIKDFIMHGIATSLVTTAKTERLTVDNVKFDGNVDKALAGVQLWNSKIINCENINGRDEGELSCYNGCVNVLFENIFAKGNRRYCIAATGQNNSNVVWNNIYAVTDRAKPSVFPFYVQNQLYGTSISNITATTEYMDATWSRVTTTATVTTPIDHNLTNGQTIYVGVTSSAAAIPAGYYTITVTGTNVFTFTCLNAGFTNGTLSYLGQTTDGVLVVNSSRNVDIKNVNIFNHKIASSGISVSATTAFATTSTDIKIHGVNAKDFYTGSIATAFFSFSNADRVFIDNFVVDGASRLLTEGTGNNIIEFARGSVQNVSAIYITDNGKSVFDNVTGVSSKWENQSSARIPSGQTSVIVNHNLTFTPKLENFNVVAESLGNAVNFRIGNISAQSFTIFVDQDPGTNGALFKWTIKTFMGDRFTEPVFTNSYTSNFTATQDSFAGTNTVVAGNIDAISDGTVSLNDNLRFYADATNSTHDVTRASVVTLSQPTRIRFKYFIPTGQTNVNGFILYGNSFFTVLDVRGTNATVGKWTEVCTNYFTPTSTSIVIRMFNNFTSTFVGANLVTNDLIYIKDMVAEYQSGTATVTNGFTGITPTFAPVVYTTNAQTLTTKTLSTGTIFSAAPTINSGIKFTFTPSTTTAGVNTGSFATDPTTLVNFDVFGNSTANVLKARLNGVTNVIATSSLTTNTLLPAMTASGTLQSSDFLSASGTKTMGLSSNAATAQTLTVDGSNANVDILIRSKANGIASLVNGTTTTNNITAQFNGVNMNSPNGTIAIGGGTNRFSFLSGTGGNELRMDNIANNYFGTATLVGGTVVVNNNKVTAQSIIFLTNAVSSGTVGALSVTARVAATSFTITSTSGTDTSTIGYIIIN